MRKQIFDVESFQDQGRYCGYSYPTGAGIVSSVTPFEMTVHTDSNEQNGEVGYEGFAMTWTQNSC